MTGMVVKLQKKLPVRKKVPRPTHVKTVVRQKHLALKNCTNYIKEQHKECTCTENGYSISVCQTCNDKKKEEIVAKGHSKGIRNKKTATCKAEGYTGDTYCRTCNTLLEEGKVLPKLEHQWNDGTVTKRATYQAAGELTYRCRKCAAKRIIP